MAQRGAVGGGPFSRPQHLAGLWNVFCVTAVMHAGCALPIEGVPWRSSAVVVNLSLPMYKWYVTLWCCFACPAATYVLSWEEVTMEP